MPAVCGIFQKHYKGDDALLQLAAQRLHESGLGFETYAESEADLLSKLRFIPSTTQTCFVHLPRHYKIFSQTDRDRIIEIMSCNHPAFKGSILHDQLDIKDNFEAYISQLKFINSALQQQDISGRHLFIEYAAGIDPYLFLRMVEALHPFELISCCIDIGHLGLHLAEKYFSLVHADRPLCHYSPDEPGLSDLIEIMDDSLHKAFRASLTIIEKIISFDKNVHFHLHDAHPLSTVSPYGVSDHLGFLDLLPVPFSFQGRNVLTPMFGPSGIDEILSLIFRCGQIGQSSFTLEIHPQEGRIPLKRHAPLFGHWQDLTNAERMNYWLECMIKNAQLVLQIINKYLH